MNISRKCFLAASFCICGLSPLLRAEPATPEELREARNWVDAKFRGAVRTESPPAGLLVLLAFSAALAAGGTLPFVTDHDKGIAEAKRTGKAGFVYFTADW